MGRTAAVARGGNPLLRDQRLLRGWTEDDVAAGLHRVAVELGESDSPRVDANHVSKWERGARVPSRYYAPRLCLLFEVPPDQVGLAATPRLLAECQRLHDVRRRGLLAMTGRLDKPFLGPTSRPASGAPIAEALEAAIRDYWRRDDQFGGETLRPAAIGQLDYVLGLLASSMAPDTMRRLHVAAAELSRLVGWMFFDARAYDLSRRYFEQAQGLARDAGDVISEANALASMSLQATYEDDPRTALTLVHGAQERSRRTATPRVAAMLAMREAFAHAALGDPAACHSALTRSHRSFERVRPDDPDPDWVRYFDEAKLIADTGIARSRLGEHREAEPLILAALEREEPSNLRPRAFHSYWLAVARLRQGKVEEACETAGGFLSLAALVESERIVGHVRDFMAELAPYERSRPAREFRGRLAGLVAEGLLSRVVRPGART
jgi:transcriptional regulator with XRE-family HTH domain